MLDGLSASRQSESFARATPPRLALLALAVIVATITGAFAFQAAGYAPCELCLKERLPYYVGIGVAALTATVVASRSRGAVPLALFGTLALLFLGSAAFGAYHAGVEWGFWPGPTDCTGTLDKAASVTDFMKQLETVKVVRCDAVAIRILGLSLAGWNAVVSLGIAAIALAGMRRSGSAP